MPLCFVMPNCECRGYSQILGQYVRMPLRLAIPNCRCQGHSLILVKQHALAFCNAEMQMSMAFNDFGLTKNMPLRFALLNCKCLRDSSIALSLDRRKRQKHIRHIRLQHQGLSHILHVGAARPLSLHGLSPMSNSNVQKPLARSVFSIEIRISP
jgi:hypothetical protein